MTESPLIRQESLNLTLPKAVAVVGVGGVGSWLALFLALAGTPKLYLFDHDEVSSSNLNRLPVPSTSVGSLKSKAITTMINSLRPTCDIYPLDKWSPELANSLKLATEISWLACTTDTLASRQAAHRWASAPMCPNCSSTNWEPTIGENIPQGTHFCLSCSTICRTVRYIEAAAEGEYGSATGSPAEWSSDLESKPGYESVPVHVGPCVIAASLAAHHILHNTPMPYVCRIGFDGTRITTLTAND